MASLNDLIQKIENPELRARIEEEIDKLAKQKKFGLVFEEHLPENSFLYGIPVKKGSKVARKTSGKIEDLYTVLKIHDGVAVCLKNGTEETEEIPVDELCAAAQFGDPIYPCLESIDSVCNAPESPLWHTLIEADNYHALQLLAYLYKGKVDCIYIDPPYNTGARDWKYNNDYVDGNDQYRHSKWLSMMQKRLKLAKKLLNPNDSVLIVTIDEKEYLHLGCLLEEIFPDARIQMVSSITNPKGVARGGFRRADEYIFVVMIGNSVPERLSLSDEWSPSVNIALTGKKSKTTTPDWTSMMRRGSHSSRQERPGLYYAIYVNPETKTIERIGKPLPPEVDKDIEIEGLVQVLPFRTSGAQGCWQVGPNELENRIKQGRVRVGSQTSYGFVINYLPDGAYKEVLSGKFVIEGKNADGSLIAVRKDLEDSDSMIAPTQWKIASHNASEYGTTLLNNLIGKRFAFPKSLYAVHDTIRFFVANKPNALIVDFFAGSGTTLHAVNLLNAEDGGSRRCILVTNNEVSDAEAKEMTARGIKPGDDEWERLGIARYVTWPRTVCSIEGHDVNGNPLKGAYLGSEIPMADGFKANAAFFKLRFLDKNNITARRQFKELLSTLWLKAGAFGKCPTIKAVVPDMLILPENRMAILNDENQLTSFVKGIEQFPEIATVFFVTDYEKHFSLLVRSLPNRTCYQLYRDYLDNFKINTAEESR